MYGEQLAFTRREIVDNLVAKGANRERLESMTPGEFAKHISPPRVQKVAPSSFGVGWEVPGRTTP